MMERCYRCQGSVLRQYDVNLREWEAYCVSCGARPDNRPRFKDGRPAGAALLCQQCNVNPRSMIQSYRIGSREVAWCIACRTEDLRKRRVFDMKRRQRMGNVLHRSFILSF
jgi:hypothetical protein